MDELISKRTAIEEVSKGCEELCGVFERCKDNLLSLPPVQPEPEEFEWCTDCKEYDQEAHCCHRWTKVIRNTVEEIKNTQPEPRWIPVTEKPPEECVEVNITWVNNEPVSYYADLKGKPFTGSGVYCKGRWYWYSAVCVDYCKEYGFSPCDVMDEEIKVTAWQPLPKPYERSEE